MTDPIADPGPPAPRVSVSGMRPRRWAWWSAGSRGLFLLALLPMGVEAIERGGWPQSPRAWMAEICSGLLVAWLVSRLRAEHAALQAESRRDPLTGMGNRPAFEEALHSRAARAHRLARPVTLLVFDLNHFRQLNAIHGEAAGDEALRQVARVFRDTLRRGADASFRIGGDEFALLLEDTPLARAAPIAERLRGWLALSQAPGQPSGGRPEGRPQELALNWGAAQWQPGEPVQAWLRRADEALYAHRRGAASHGGGAAEVDGAHAAHAAGGGAGGAGEAGSPGMAAAGAAAGCSAKAQT